MPTSSTGRGLHTSTEFCEKCGRPQSVTLDCEGPDQGVGLTDICVQVVDGYARVRVLTCAVCYGDGGTK
jgi:hypothetical protein